MVNYIRPATEPRTSRGWVFFSFAARAATWLVAADPWRGNEQRAFGLCPSELCIYCYRYAEASSSWRWKRATRAERTARGCTIARPLSPPWDRVQWTDSRVNEARFAGIIEMGGNIESFELNSWDRFSCWIDIWISKFLKFSFRQGSCNFEFNRGISGCEIWTIVRLSR